MNKILVGTDTSGSADMAVRAAAGLAEATGAELLILHVRAPNGDHDAADPRKAADPGAYLEAMRARFPAIRLRAWSEPGNAAERLVDVAETERVDTIVVGNKGVHGPRWRVRDSVPTMVVRHAPCSVLIVDTRSAQ
ncbi:MAG TPA: universal stress protein [Actinomycetota bacterium]|nr:universal stress protein [Actinomycetota bacterium]